MVIGKQLGQTEDHKKIENRNKTKGGEKKEMTTYEEKAFGNNVDRELEKHHSSTGDPGAMAVDAICRMNMR